MGQPVCKVGSHVRVFPTKVAVFFLGLFLVYYGIISTLHNSSSKYNVKTKEELKKTHDEILRLSKLYVKDLAESHSNVDDGPAAFPDTGYDMKKALAVLISDLNQRVEDLGSRIEALEQHIPGDTAKEEPRKRKALGEPGLLSAADLVNDKQDECPYPSFENWPYCETKIKWMREMWKSDPCYAEWGVDGGNCSVLVYLSEQEYWCPPFPWRVDRILKEQSLKEYNLATIQLDFSSLYELMGDSIHFKWITSRIERMSPRWVQACKDVSKKAGFEKRKRKKVLILMGLLSDDVGWKIAENAFKGGPLGELVQWSDIISAIYTLGHDITFAKSTSEVDKIYSPFLQSASSNCPLKNSPFDIVYSDIAGLKILKKVSKKKFHLLECNLRVIDSFGTEPEFNHPNYASKKSHKTSWGKWNLNPKQFNTMFPHSPDNTFLGFVVEEHLNDTSVSDIPKEDIALVYGKRDGFWQEHENYISAIHDVIEVHSTVDESKPLLHVPKFVRNHGVLPGMELHRLLRRTKVFVGLGFPYEGPAPLEAIANGAVFLNPVFDVPKDSLNTPFFKGKPTLRKLTSQHPYAEMYIGHPHVRSIHMNDLESVQTIIREVLNSKEEIKPYLPYEFTCAGMLERLSLYLEKQDFCSGSVDSSWPPQSALQIKITDEKQTCSEICYSNGLICEPAYFPYLNKKSTFTSLNISCSEFVSTTSTPEIDYPAFLKDRCFLQSENKLFSCAGRYTDMKRLCPCRDFLPGQVSLCKDCLNF